MRQGVPIYKRMGRAIATGSMPFRVMANPPVENLTAKEREVLLDWLEKGAPRGSCP